MWRPMWRTGSLALIVVVLAGLAAAQDALPRLYGVVLTGQGGAAYLEDPATGSVRPYRVGETIGERQVVRIEADRVVLRRGSESVEVPLAGAPAATDAGGTAAVSPPPATEDATAGPSATAGEAGPCPPSCPPATTILPGSPTPGQPCPPSCPSLDTMAAGQGAPAGSAECPPNCPPPPPAPAGSSQPCPPSCPPESVADPGRAGPVPGGARP